MQTQKTEYPVVTAVVDIIAAWWKRHGHRTDDLTGLSNADVDRIAQDIGLSAADLRALDRSCTVLLLPRMMKALHMDPSEIQRAQPVVFRDLQRVCALCDSKKRCAHDLADGTAASHFEEYCPNTSTLKSLEPA